MAVQLLQIGPGGELTLPAAAWEALGLQPGGRVRLDADPERHTIILTAERPIAVTEAKKYALSDLIGMGGKFPRAISQEEIDEAVRRCAAERFLEE